MNCLPVWLEWIVCLSVWNELFYLSGWNELFTWLGGMDCLPVWVEWFVYLSGWNKLFTCLGGMNCLPVSVEWSVYLFGWNEVFTCLDGISCLPVWVECKVSSVPFACVGSGDPVRVLCLYTTNTLDIFWSIYYWGICTTCRYQFYCVMLKPYALRLPTATATAVRGLTPRSDCLKVPS